MLHETIEHLIFLNQFIKPLNDEIEQQIIHYSTQLLRCIGEMDRITIYNIDELNNQVFFELPYTDNKDSITIELHNKEAFFKMFLNWLSIISFINRAKDNKYKIEYLIQ